MALFRREVPVQIVFDNDQFIAIKEQVMDMVGQVDDAVARLVQARAELDTAAANFDKSIDRSIAKLKRAQQRTRT